MTPDQIALIRSNWSAVAPISDTAAQLFYGRLFELDPTLRPLFKGDMAEQGRKLMAMLGTVVGRLDQLGEILPAVQSLGRRHAGYGVQDAHYGTVAQALLWTLEQGLGPAFTPPAREAWTQAYTVLAGAMQAAAASPTASPATGA